MYYAMSLESTDRNPLFRKEDVKMTHPIRILIAKPGLDGHDRGAKILAQALRNAGMEVIYTGLRQTPEQIVHTAIQEDVELIALSCLSGAHNHLFPRVIELLKLEGIDDILVIGGGVIPEEDIPSLMNAGIAEIFTSGTQIKHIVEFIKSNVRG
jgi:methylmalonyl-CoA mutase C-terminal domain/subunit